MKTLVVPTEYKSIQEAVNASKSGDRIEVLPGYYDEEVVIKKDNISLIGSTNTIFETNSKNKRAISIYANNVTVSGFIIQYYDSSIISTGNNNKILGLIALYNSRGLIIDGNYNIIQNCIFENNKEIGISLSGNYNQIISNRVSYNFRGIACLDKSVVGNIFFKNIVINNTQLNVRISSTNADRNVFVENTVSDSPYGLLVKFGRAAIISNYINNSSTVGISYKGNKGIIVENYVSDCGVGMYIKNCDSVIAGNTIQKSSTTGIALTGGNNYIVRNVVSTSQDTGLLVNGCDNNICNNQLIKNTINFINNGCNNLDCNLEYCAGLGCRTYNNYLDLLKLFDMNNRKFFK